MMTNNTDSIDYVAQILEALKLMANLPEGVPPSIAGILLSRALGVVEEKWPQAEDFIAALSTARDKTWAVAHAERHLAGPVLAAALTAIDQVAPAELAEFVRDAQ